jgi:hypothetical protein
MLVMEFGMAHLLGDREIELLFCDNNIHRIFIFAAKLYRGTVHCDLRVQV